jgi:hypothetical protein
VVEAYLEQISRRREAHLAVISAVLGGDTRNVHAARLEGGAEGGDVHVPG